MPSAASVVLLTLSASSARMSASAVEQLMGCSRLSSTLAYLDAQPSARNSDARATTAILYRLPKPIRDLFPDGPFTLSALASRSRRAARPSFPPGARGTAGVPAPHKG